ncbi:nuclear transport factor 2 family protein [Streptomyces winkii]|uniref:nuclear transport factor 2 family protein n=1 Tax=Streptomyces winkii TaxID=3051178 RepID=UPI0028D687B7|nr:nuclear transport factor 2 family protein [Streptomyces sp. DSM 40971]
MNVDDALATLLSRYFAAVDDKGLDAEVVAATFTPDGRIVRPNGETLTGRDEILARQSASFARFRFTHHMLTNHLVERDGDTARIRANMQAMHLWGDGHRDPHELVTHFVAGGVIRAVAALTPDGWRLTELALRPMWRTGASLGMMASA